MKRYLLAAVRSVSILMLAASPAMARNDNGPFPGISAECGSTGCKTRQSNERECRADKKRLLECLNQGDSGYGMICHRALYSCLKGVEE
jgi:hypothetical protein